MREDELPLLDDTGEAGGRPGRFRLLSKVALDLTPLRESRDFRRLVFGTGISAVGSQITTVAIPFQVYDQTKSTLLVGLLAIAALVPLLTVPLYAGAVADAVDRRRLLLLSDVALAAVTVVLIGNALLPEPSIPILFFCEAASTAAYAFQRPARNALTPRLVGEHRIAAAIAVEDVFFTLPRVAGPALGGALISTVGLAGAYAVDLGTFAASMLAIWLLPPVPAAAGTPRPGLASIVEGFRYVSTKPVLLGSFLIDTNAMIFGMPAALFPAFAEDVGGSASDVGFLYAALSAGAFAASIFSGWIGHVRRQGLWVAVAAAAWGAAIVAFGFAGSVPLAVAFLAVAGAADFVSAVLRSTILLATTPDELRGRLSGIELAQVAGAPQLGNVEAGVLASLTSVRFSIVSGGLVCVVGTVLLLAAVPKFLRYDARRPRE